MRNLTIRAGNREMPLAMVCSIAVALGWLPLPVLHLAFTFY